MTILRTATALVCACALLLTACSRYSDEEHNKNVLNGMLVHEEYEDLEEALAEAEKQYLLQKITARQLQDRWHTLADINADGVIARFDAWVARTGSGYAHLSRGSYLQVQAWETRGGKLARDTSAAQFAQFKQLAERAEEDLVVAQQKLSVCVLCAAERIRVNRALGRPLEDSVQLLDEALSIDPKMPAAVFSFFPSLFPQWGGSFGQMRAFIEEMEGRVQDPAIIAELESRYAWEQARAAESRNDEEAAFDWYRRGVTDHPYDMLMKNLAESYSKRGEYQKAIETLEQNLSINNPWDLYTVEALAQAYFSAGRQEDGEAMMRKRDELQSRYNSFQ